jgi:hypothetical protein
MERPVYSTYMGVYINAEAWTGPRWGGGGVGLSQLNTADWLTCAQKRVPSAVISGQLFISQ